MAKLASEAEMKAMLKGSWRSQREIASAVGISERHLRRIATTGRGGSADLRARIVAEATRFPDHWCACRRESVQTFVIALVNELVPVLNQVEEERGFDGDAVLAAAAARHVGLKIRDAIDRRDAALLPSQWERR